MRYLLLLAFSFTVSIATYGQTLTVWPGDANSDSVVNNYDVLYIGQGYNTQGNPRDTFNITWQGDTVLAWPNFTGDGTNYAYIDCNGNGFIDEDDLAVVDANYGLALATLPPDTISIIDSTAPFIYFNSLPDTLRPGDTVTIDVFAGSANAPAVFFGIALTILYDSTLIVPGSITAFPDLLLSTPVDPLLFLAKENGINGGNGGEFDIAMTKRKNTGGTSGTNMVREGERLLTVSFIIEDNLIGAALAGGFPLEITKVRLLDNNFSSFPTLKDGVNIPLALPVSVAPEPQFEKLRFYPQPASNILIVEGLPEKGQITLTDLTGKTMIQEQLNGTGAARIDCSKLATGLYLVNIEIATGNAVRKILID